MSSIDCLTWQTQITTHSDHGPPSHRYDPVRDLNETLQQQVRTSTIEYFVTVLKFIQQGTEPGGLLPPLDLDPWRQHDHQPQSSARVADAFDSVYTNEGHSALFSESREAPIPRLGSPFELILHPPPQTSRSTSPVISSSAEKRTRTNDWETEESDLDTPQQAPLGKGKERQQEVRFTRGTNDCPTKLTHVLALR